MLSCNHSLVNSDGYAYEATNAVLQRLCEHAGFKTIVATTIPSNEKSARLLTKLNFSFDKRIDLENSVVNFYKIIIQA